VVAVTDAHVTHARPWVTAPMANRHLSHGGKDA
jgi:hypothetical protein